MRSWGVFCRKQLTCDPLTPAQSKPDLCHVMLTRFPTNCGPGGPPTHTSEKWGQAVQSKVQNMTLGAQAHPKVIQMGFQREPLGAPKAPSGAQRSPMEYQGVPKAPVTVQISGPASPHGLHYGRPAPKSWRCDNLWHRVMLVFGGWSAPWTWTRCKVWIKAAQGAAADSSIYIYIYTYIYIAYIYINILNINIHININI